MDKLLSLAIAGVVGWFVFDKTKPESLPPTDITQKGGDPKSTKRTRTRKKKDKS